MSRPTLKQIAQLSGLSVATVSRVLRGKPSVSESAVRAVETAVRTLGYGRATGECSAIAVVQAVPVGSDVDPYESLFLHVSERLFEVGRAAVRVLTGPGIPPATPMLASSGIRGALVLGGSSAGPEAVRMQEEGIRVLRIAQSTYAETAQIVLDPTTSLNTALSHLVNLGHTRIGLAVPRNSAAAARISTFRKRLAELLHISATRDQAPVAMAEPGLPAGIHAAQKLLMANCTAVIATSPSLTFGFLEAARRERLSVPEHVSLLTVGDISDADVLNPPVSQVTYDWQAVAETAVGMLETMLSRPGYMPAYSMSPELVLRSSEKPIRRR